MEWTTVWVVSAGLSEVGEVLELVSEELSGDVDVLTSHDDDLLAVEKLLGDCRGESSKKVALCVNDDLTFESCDTSQRTHFTLRLTSSLVDDIRESCQGRSLRRRIESTTHCS